MVYIPSQDHINEIILELQTSGYLDALSQTERPWLASDVIDAILEDELAFDPDGRALAEEILSYLQLPQRADNEPLTAGAAFRDRCARFIQGKPRRDIFTFATTFINRDFKSEAGAVFKGRVMLSREERWGIDTELLFDTDGTGYPWYYGRPHNARIIGQFDRAYIRFALDRFNFMLGR